MSNIKEVPSPQEIVIQNEYGRIIVMDSITFSDKRNNSGDVLVGASFCGILSIRWPLRVNPKGVICHAAGPGLERAGENGLFALEAAKIPGATAETMSCRIADGQDMYNNGVVDRLNDSAHLLGVSSGMSIKEAAQRMLEYWPVLPEVYKPCVVAHESRHGKVMAMGSVTFIETEHRGRVVCAGSHFGQTSAAYSSRFDLAGVMCNDAGFCKDRSGVSGLKVLDEVNIPGAAVSVYTARIGDGFSTYSDGIISAYNLAARKVGISEGITAKVAAELMLKAYSLKN